jgi:hypothetical protein
VTPEQLLAIQRLLADLYNQLNAAQVRVQELEAEGRGDVPEPDPAEGDQHNAHGQPQQ